MSDFQTQLLNLLHTLQLDEEPAGGCVVIYHKGKLLASASVGKAQSNVNWQPDTLSLNYSTGKGVLATLIHVLVSNDMINYESPISTYWPEFSENVEGKLQQQKKASITLKDLLTHRAGLYNLQSITDSTSDMLNWSKMISRVEKMPQEQPINTDAESCYSALVSGWVLGGLIEKVTDMSLNEALDTYLAQPLGVSGEMYFGVPENKVQHVAILPKYFEFNEHECKDNLENSRKNSLTNNNEISANEHHAKRSKTTLKASKPKLRKDSERVLNAYKSLPSYECWQNLNNAKNTSNELTTMDIANLYFEMKNINLQDYKHALVASRRELINYYDKQTLMAKIPAANNVASAGALAKMFAMLANKGEFEGSKLINTKTFGQLSQIYVTGSDAVMAAAEPKSMLWRLGYHRMFSRCNKMPEAFGHMGYNGSVAWCDLSRQLSVVYVHNYDVTMSTDIRQFAIIEAITSWIDALNN